jgi:hypothetical protein
VSTRFVNTLIEIMVTTWVIAAVAIFAAIVIPLAITTIVAVLQ